MTEENTENKEGVKIVETKVPEKTFIDINDFAKVELKIGKILEYHIVEGADKLYRFSVDVGEKNEQGEAQPRTILSGIREYFPEGEMFVGKYVCVVANLAPRKLRGFESNGMLLFAGGDAGELFMVSPVGEPVPGTIIR